MYRTLLAAQRFRRCAIKRARVRVMANEVFIFVRVAEVSREVSREISFGLLCKPVFTRSAADDAETALPCASV